MASITKPTKTMLLVELLFDISDDLLLVINHYSLMVIWKLVTFEGLVFSNYVEVISI
jgi:hypothetical protein